VSDTDMKCVRVLIDENGYDIETRILYDTLIKHGWTPPVRGQSAATTG